MKVFINGQLYSAEEVPIVVILDDADKHNIAGMPPGHYRYGVFSDTMDPNDCQAVMDELSTLLHNLDCKCGTSVEVSGPNPEC